MKNVMAKMTGLVMFVGVVCLVGCSKKAESEPVGTMDKAMEATTNGAVQAVEAVTNAAVNAAVTTTNLTRQAVQ